MERNCVYMLSGKDVNKDQAYTAARCDYNENNAIQFVCQSNFKSFFNKFNFYLLEPRTRNRCGTGGNGGNTDAAQSVCISAILALALTFLH